MAAKKARTEAKREHQRENRAAWKRHRMETGADDDDDFKEFGSEEETERHGAHLICYGIFNLSFTLTLDDVLPV